MILAFDRELTLYMVYMYSTHMHTYSIYHTKIQLVLISRRHGHVSKAALPTKSANGVSVHGVLILVEVGNEWMEDTLVLRAFCVGRIEVLMADVDQTDC